jgi:hypothetical protein
VSPVRHNTVSTGGVATKKPVANNSSSRTNATTPPRGTGPKKQGVAEEETLRQTVTALFEEEEAILNTHMSNIQENAELLTMEGDLLAEVQLPGRTAEDIEQYATALEEILEQKEDMIIGLRKQMAAFKELLRKERSKKVGTLA